MKKKMFFKVLVCTIASLFLSAFTTQTNDTNETSQEAFDYEVEKLDEDLDRKAILDTDSLDVENQLSEADHQTIQEFIHIEEFHIELDEGVYSAMPTNDLCISIDDYREQTGFDYQEDNDEYLHNYKALSFVTDNIAVMNDFAENGYGAMQEDGMMSIEVTDFSQQSFIMNFHI